MAGGVVVVRPLLLSRSSRDLDALGSIPATIHWEVASSWGQRQVDIEDIIHLWM